MLKYLSLLVILFNVLLIGGCSADVDPANQQTSLEQQTDEQDNSEEEKAIGDGDVIKTESLELTLNKVAFSHDVLPEELNTVYTHYEADEGKVYIDVAVSVKNLDKSALSCDKVMTVSADYNDGYQYSAFPIVEDDKTGFTYSNISVIDPLETRGMRFLIDCPAEVEDSNNSLFVLFDIDGQSYKYVLRDGKTTEQDTKD